MSSPTQLLKADPGHQQGDPVFSLGLASLRILRAG
jgi:hypothetical protein